MRSNADSQGRLKTARRIFGLIPVLVFLLTFVLFVQHIGARAAQDASIVPAYLFTELLLRSLVASLASALLCVAAYSFYRYLLERSPGL